MTNKDQELEKQKGRAPQAFVQAAADFERSKIEEVKKSRKLAWIIAGVCTGVTTISIAAFLVALLTRPEPEPTIIQVDKSTGSTTVMRSIKDDQDKYEEVVDKYWLAQYVRMREGYDWYTVSEQFEIAKLMSAKDVGAEYTKTVWAENAPLKTLKDKGKIVVKVGAITFVKGMAQVRFTTEKQLTNGENPDGSPVQKWIATMAYRYNAGWMTDQQRLANPLGFKALTYRVDPEVIK